MRRGRRWSLVLPVECGGGGAWERRRGGSLWTGEWADRRLVIQWKRWQRRRQLQRRRNLERARGIKKWTPGNLLLTCDPGTMRALYHSTNEATTGQQKQHKLCMKTGETVRHSFHRPMRTNTPANASLLVTTS